MNLSQKEETPSGKTNKEKSRKKSILSKISQIERKKSFKISNKSTDNGQKKSEIEQSSQVQSKSSEKLKKSLSSISESPIVTKQAKRNSKNNTSLIKYEQPRISITKLSNEFLNNNKTNEKDSNPYADHQNNKAEIVHQHRKSRTKLNKFSSEQRQTEGLELIQGKLENKFAVINYKDSDDSSNISKSAEQEGSEEEVSPLQDNKQLPAMKRISLFRRPTEDFSSPKKSRSPKYQEEIEEKFKEIMQANENEKVEQITQDLKQYVDMKTDELREEVNEINSNTKIEFNSSINLNRDYMKEEVKSLLQVIMKTNDEFLVHLQEEIKRRNRDKSDLTCKVDKLEEIVHQCAHVKTINEESVYSLGEVVRSIINIIHLDSILGSKDEEDRKSIFYNFKS